MPLGVAAEAKLNSDPCVVAWDHRLFVGTEDGSIQSFDAKLTAQESWAAHTVQLFALAAGGGHVYSASSDSGIKVWSATGEKIAELPPTGGDVGVLRVFGQHLYAGNEIGNITVFENNAQKAKYNVLEEVKDLWFDPPFLYTARDLDVTITEIKPDDSKTRFMTRHTMEGRTPLRVAGGRLVLMARGGTRMRLHHAAAEHSFKMLDEVQVSDMIVTSMSVEGDTVWTGGWDGCVRRWTTAGDQLQAAGQLALGSCVNALCAAPGGGVFAAVAGGRVVAVV